MKISEKGINFIINEEGEKLKAYICPAGVLTIGVGHTGKDVVPGMIITKEHSRELLKNDLKHFENAVEAYVKISLKQHEYDSLISFAFNVGAEAFKKSTLLKKINALAPMIEIEAEFRSGLEVVEKFFQFFKKEEKEK